MGAFYEGKEVHVNFFLGKTQGKIFEVSYGLRGYYATQFCVRVAAFRRKPVSTFRVEQNPSTEIYYVDQIEITFRDIFKIDISQISIFRHIGQCMVAAELFRPSQLVPHAGLCVKRCFRQILNKIEICDEISVKFPNIKFH